MDPTLTDFPVLSYVMFGSAGPIYPAAPPGAAYDIEQPPQPPSPPSTFADPLIERMPHLKDPKIIATMSEAVTEIAQTRSVLQTLGERPDHETIDIAKARLARIEGDPSQELEEILLTPRPSNEAERARRESLEREKEKYRAIIKLDEMHEAYQKMLRDAEEKLMKIYDSSVVDNGDEKEVENELGSDEEVVRVLQQEEIMTERVDLCGRKLRVLPEAFGKLHGLVSLNLAGNLLQAIPDPIAGLGNLEELNLSHNSLESLPDSIGLLLNLKYLNVPGNKLSSLPDSISHCRSLVELDASFNTLGYLPTNIGYELVHLRKLLVPYNKIRSLPSSIGELKSLQHLDLHFNELHGLPITIGKLTNLVTLNLSGNFSDLKELPESFGELINLEDLDLSNNQIHALPDSFFNLEKLVKLNLDQNPITIPPVEVLNDGVESVRTYMAKRWADLIEEEEEMNRLQMQEESEPGWLTRSVSKLGGVVSSVSEYLGSPRTSRDPCLDQEL